MEKPLLSICIPTFQRCDVLKKTIESIVSSQKFLNTNQIEIVISNNASTDDTDGYCRQLVQLFPGKIQYNCNSENIGDRNFDLVLRMARGRLRKFHNDSFLIKEEFFDEVLSIVKQVEGIKPILFFLNGNGPIDEPLTTCSTGDELISHIGYYITWFGGFTIWDDDLMNLDDFGRMADRRFIQVDNILRFLNAGRKFLVFNKSYFAGQNFGKSLGYNAAQVFGDNLIDLFKDSVGSGKFSDTAFFNFKHKLFLEHIVPSHFDKKLGSLRTGFNNFLKSYYSDIDYLNFIKNSFFPRAGLSIDPKILLNNLIWRKVNAGNETSLQNYFDLDKVAVGLKTYGALNVNSWGESVEKLEIGALCSIGDNVNFMLGGNHDLHYLTTYPFKVKLGLAANEASSKGMITVEDDVWIGNNCTILSGVRIGRGAVIGTGAVVAKDIPPYAIAVGNPAKVVKYRFSPEIINILMKIDLKKLAALSDLANHIEMLYTLVDEKSSEAILDYFAKLDCLA